MSDSYHMECDCIDWVNSLEQIIGAQTLAWTHGMEYTGTVVKYCPWCGKKLRRVENERTGRWIMERCL